MRLKPTFFRSSYRSGTDHAPCERGLPFGDPDPRSLLLSYAQTNNHRHDSVHAVLKDPYTNEGPILNADEAVDLVTMIEAYTINGAYLMKLDGMQGSIEVGKRADFVVLDRNLFDIPSHEINEAQVTLTIFDGRTVYQR